MFTSTALLIANVCYAGSNWGTSYYRPISFQEDEYKMNTILLFCGMSFSRIVVPYP